MNVPDDASQKDHVTENSDTWQSMDVPEDEKWPEDGRDAKADASEPLAVAEDIDGQKRGSCCHRFRRVLQTTRAVFWKGFGVSASAESDPLLDDLFERKVRVDSRLFDARLLVPYLTWRLCLLICQFLFAVVFLSLSSYHFSKQDKEDALAEMLNKTKAIPGSVIEPEHVKPLLQYFNLMDVFVLIIDCIAFFGACVALWCALPRNALKFASVSFFCNAAGWLIRFAIHYLIYLAVPFNSFIDWKGIDRNFCEKSMTFYVELQPVNEVLKSMEYFGGPLGDFDPVTFCSDGIISSKSGISFEQKPGEWIPNFYDTVFNCVHGVAVSAIDFCNTTPYVAEQALCLSAPLDYLCMKGMKTTFDQMWDKSCANKLGSTQSVSNLNKACPINWYWTYAIDTYDNSQVSYYVDLLVNQSNQTNATSLDNISCCWGATLMDSVTKVVCGVDLNELANDASVEIMRLAFEQLIADYTSEELENVLAGNPLQASEQNITEFQMQWCGYAANLTSWTYAQYDAYNLTNMTAADAAAIVRLLLSASVRASLPENMTSYLDTAIANAQKLSNFVMSLEIDGTYLLTTQRITGTFFSTYAFARTVPTTFAVISGLIAGAAQLDAFFPIHMQPSNIMFYLGSCNLPYQVMIGCALLQMLNDGDDATITIFVYLLIFLQAQPILRGLWTRSAGSTDVLSYRTKVMKILKNLTALTMGILLVVYVVTNIIDRNAEETVKQMVSDYRERADLTNVIKNVFAFLWRRMSSTLLFGDILILQMAMSEHWEDRMSVAEESKSNREHGYLYVRTKATEDLMKLYDYSTKGTEATEMMNAFTSSLLSKKNDSGEEKDAQDQAPRRVTSNF